MRQKDKDQVYCTNLKTEFITNNNFLYNHVHLIVAKSHRVRHNLLGIIGIIISIHVHTYQLKTQTFQHQ